LEKLNFIQGNLQNTILNTLSNIEQNKDFHKIYIELFEKNEKLINLSNTHIQRNIIPGENIYIFNNNYNTKISKLSTRNIFDLNMEYQEEGEFRNKNFLRRLNEKDFNENNCEKMAFCFNKDKIIKYMDSTPNKKIAEIDFKLKLNKNRFLNVELNSTRRVFSETSLDFNIDFMGKDKKRILTNTSSKINYEMRLKLNENSFINNTLISDTACVKYDENKNIDNSCESWYDEASLEVNCSCRNQGLVVNIMDKFVSNINILIQFPVLTIGISK